MSVTFPRDREMGTWRAALAGKAAYSGEGARLGFAEFREAARYIGREFNLPGNSKNKVSRAEVDAFERAAQDPNVFVPAANKILSKLAPQDRHESQRMTIDRLLCALKRGLEVG